MEYRNRDTGEVISYGQERDFDRFIARRARRLLGWERALSGLDWERYRVKRVTLTYRPGVEWEPGHITEYRMRVSRELGELLIAYMWWAELQVKRGMVHYHMVMVIRKGRGGWLPKPDESYMWEHGMSKIEDLGRVDVKYALTRYGVKVEQMGGSFPKGVRKYAVWISEDEVGKGEYWRYRLTIHQGWLSKLALEKMRESDWFCAWILMPRRDDWGQWWIGSKRVVSPWERVVWLPGMSRVV